MKLYHTIFGIIFILILSCSEDKIDFVETGKLTGRVIETESFEPLSNAKVSLNPTNNTIFTDVEGYFNFEEVPKGEYSVKAEKEGYLAGNQPATIDAGVTVNLIFEMNFSDALNKPPVAPVLISPSDNAVNLPTTVELKWKKSTDPDEDELLYTVNVRNDFDSSIIEINELTDTIYTLSNLHHGVKYFWQVKVTDEINEAVSSEISVFQTTSFPDNRFLYVKNMQGNNVIYSDDITHESIALTLEQNNSFRPRKNFATKKIAFLRSVGSETHLFTMKPDGNEIKQITNQFPVSGFRQSELDFAWSTNGSKIIYPTFDKLFMINNDGSGNHLVYQTPNGHMITECDWSYDGSKIAIKTNNINGYQSSIYIINVNGSILQTIVTEGIGAFGGLNFSIDAKYLLYTHDIGLFEDYSYRQLNTHIFLYDLTTDIMTDLSENKEDGTNDLDPRFSPNEAKIVFVNTSNDGVSTKYIYTMDLAGENRTQLFENTYMPDWE